MIEYEIYRQRSAELVGLAAQRRLAEEAVRLRRQARREARATRVQRLSALGRLIAARRPAPRAERARADLGTC